MWEFVFENKKTKEQKVFYKHSQVFCPCLGEDWFLAWREFID